ncbi:hypothetical protein CAI21_07565 [Alkalilimnicola ehrlichii]|uniref:Uncharacterized protein n=1 Tax=Alkalilimnicola ehrlichii TaxID=351052 RepID=A0A3E0WWM5_9GAMM|nr:efflux RND transporter periplasmic adaptor subunit [Alkalilimnicola ehrlichii]RFA30059.1 hypothetical protein CAI21_07565 [Alkalilimnicola ehrlichii]RFA37400.1 hypothetical protein CAL65_08900 [Alkalilimnicola ehrlichii]
MRRKSLLIAAGLALALVLWLASGHLTREVAGTPPADAARPAPTPFLVRAEWHEATPVDRTLTLQGQTEPNRYVTLRSETSGPVAELLVRQGARVERGQTILRLSEAERLSRLEQARAQLEQAQVAYDAARGLADEGYQADIETRQAFAALQQAQAEVRAAEESVRQIEVRAPFSGIFNQRFVEEGDYVSPGTEIGVIVNNDPLQVRVDVPQQAIGQINTDSPVRIRLFGHDAVEGQIRYISASADTGTRTFPVEIHIENPGGSIPAGISAETQIVLGRVPGHFLSPAQLSLNAAGILGVKTVDEDSRVEFHPIELIRSQPDGVWVAGLPEEALIITVGQGFVDAGQEVRVSLAGEDE